jgi:DNA invertase Pin-like site-specific DNA recombinase
MIRAGKRVAIYARQTTDNQKAELTRWAENGGCIVMAVYEDKLSGAKGRDERPGFDAMVKAAVRREFDRQIGLAALCRT